MKRGPQSVQSVPYAQLAPVAPGPPSWQNELFSYGPPGPDECARHSSEHIMGGGEGGGGEAGEAGGVEGGGGEGGGEGRGGEGGR